MTTVPQTERQTFPPLPTLKILSLTVFICNIEVLKARLSRWGVNASTWRTSASWDRSDCVRMSRPLMRRDLKAHSDLFRLSHTTPKRKNVAYGKSGSDRGNICGGPITE